MILVISYPDSPDCNRDRDFAQFAVKKYRNQKDREDIERKKRQVRK